MITGSDKHVIQLVLVFPVLRKLLANAARQSVDRPTSCCSAFARTVAKSETVDPGIPIFRLEYKKQLLLVKHRCTGCSNSLSELQFFSGNAGSEFVGPTKLKSI